MGVSLTCRSPALRKCKVPGRSDGTCAFACVSLCRCCAFDFPTKGILQEAVKHTQYNRLRDGKVRYAHGTSEIRWKQARIPRLLSSS